MESGWRDRFCKLYNSHAELTSGPHRSSTISAAACAPAIRIPFALVTRTSADDEDTAAAAAAVKIPMLPQRRLRSDDSWATST